MAATTHLSGAAELIGHDRRDGDTIVFADARITAIGRGGPPRAADRRFDASGLLASPGFIDVQVNGAHGIDVTNAPERSGEVGSHLCRYGVTSFLPTVITCSPRQRAAALAATLGAAGGAVPIGWHLEGPMLAPGHRGAHPERWLAPPSPALVAGWSRDAGVAMVTLAPELPGALGTIARLVEAGIVVAIGHTAADAECVAAARHAGATCVTHLFNAMAPFGHRAPGPIGATLADDTLVAGLICDGIHVDPVAVRMAWRSLGPDRIVLVTDATAALGLPPGRHRLGDTVIDVSAGGVRTADGTLAGSDLALDQAVRNLVEFTGCSIAEAVGTVTANPARLLGLDGRGALAVGHRADITLLGADRRVVATFVGGEAAFVSEAEAWRWRS